MRKIDNIQSILSARKVEAISELKKIKEDCETLLVRAQKDNFSSLGLSLQNVWRTHRLLGEIEGMELAIHDTIGKCDGHCTCNTRIENSIKSTEKVV